MVNFGSHELLDLNLHCAPDPVERTAMVVVVDNFSTMDERAAVRQLCGERGWHLVPQADNPGFGAGCNAGVRFAAARGAASVLLVNPDAVVSATVAQELHSHVVAEPRTLISPRIATSTGDPYFHGIQLDLRSGRMRGRARPDADAPARHYLTSDAANRDWLSGACMAFSLELWDRSGGFDEGYFLYWEDVDFSQRCVRAGARLCLRQDLEVVHDEGATHGQQQSRARSSTYYYYNCRNRLLYASRHLGPRLRWRWFWRTPAESRQILLRGGRRQLLHSSAPLRAAVGGTLAGVGVLLRPPPSVR